MRTNIFIMETLNVIFTEVTGTRTNKKNQTRSNFKAFLRKAADVMQDLANGAAYAMRH